MIRNSTNIAVSIYWNLFHSYDINENISEYENDSSMKIACHTDRHTMSTQDEVEWCDIVLYML